MKPLGGLPVLLKGAEAKNHFNGFIERELNRGVRI